MELSYVLEVAISSIIIGIFLIYSGKHFLDTKLTINVNSILLIFCLFVFITLNHILLDNVTRFITVYVVVTLIFRILYKKDVVQCAVSTIISYFIVLIGEVLFTLLIIGAQKIGIVDNIANYTGSIIANIFICSISLILFFPLKGLCARTISKIKQNNKISMFFTFLIVLLAISSLFYKMLINNWQVNSNLALNVIMIICLMYIGFIIIRQHIEKIKISDEYENFVIYAKQSEDLVERYSISKHENQNELIIIRSMVHKSNKKLLEYLDEIIKNKENFGDAWIRYLRYIPFGGLKGIIHNKISIMKEQKLNVCFNISRDVGNSVLKKLEIKENNQLSKIIGVFLDNAKEAALDSERKEISIYVYVKDEDVIFEISNTYSNNIELSKIYNSGYSSKGKSRGHGLTLVKMILDENPRFENYTQLVDDYFVQFLKVKK